MTAKVPNQTIFLTSGKWSARDIRNHFIDANKMVAAVFPGEKIVATLSQQCG